jgi:hypothetical protein
VLLGRTSKKNSLHSIFTLQQLGVCVVAGLKFEKKVFGEVA